LDEFKSIGLLHRQNFSRSIWAKCESIECGEDPTKQSQGNKRNCEVGWLDLAFIDIKGCNEV
jgi:hypothetical protein